MFGIKRILKHELDSLIGVNISTKEYIEMFSVENYKRECSKDDEGYYRKINGVKLYVEPYKTKTLCLYLEKNGQRYFYIQ